MHPLCDAHEETLDLNSFSSGVMFVHEPPVQAPAVYARQSWSRDICAGPGLLGPFSALDVG